jgi:hypothetical protein
MKISYKGDSEGLRIYFNGILQLRIPRNKDVILHSWLKTDTKLFYIEIKFPNNSIIVEYEDKNTWEEVLRLLNKNI